MILFSRRLPKVARENLAELQRMESYFSLAAELAGKNTGLLNPHGKQFASHLKTTADLISQHKNNIARAVLKAMGFTNALVNFSTGRIKPLPDVPRDNPEAGK